jgi:hypothetical protein
VLFRASRRSDCGRRGDAALERENRVELDCVRRDTVLVVVEVEERNTDNLGTEPTARLLLFN